MISRQNIPQYTSFNRLAPDKAQDRRVAPAWIRASLALLLLCGLAAPSTAQYIDPWGLPSGSAEMALVYQDSIDTGAAVDGFDFAGGEVIADQDYDEISEGGIVDLVYLEITPGEDAHYLGAPDGGENFDRLTMYALGPDLELDEVENCYDESGVLLEMSSFVLAEAGGVYLCLQVDAAGDTTVAKFKLTTLEDDVIAFDWVWQPNGSFFFIPPPPATETSSFGRIKSLY